MVNQTYTLVYTSNYWAVCSIYYIWHMKLTIHNILDYINGSSLEIQNKTYTIVGSKIICSNPETSKTEEYFFTINDYEGLYKINCRNENINGLIIVILPPEGLYLVKEEALECLTRTISS